MTNLQLKLFGTFQLLVDGEPVTTPLWAKSQALLAYLAVESDRPHRREVLAGMFWPDQPDQQARNSLRQALHQLQRAWPAARPEWMAATAQTVQLKQIDEFELDTTVFSMLLSACERHDHRRPESCPACIERLQQAVQRYQGDFLSQLFVKDSTAFEEWALLRREQFQRKAISALRSLSRYYERQGLFEPMRETAQRQLSLDPFDETALRQVMAALSWDGRRNAALAVYEAGRQRLAAELAVEPEPATTTLAQQIRTGKNPPPLLPRRHNWPRRMTNFVGRVDESARLVTWLQDPQIKLITLIGPGGVGKTRLALTAVEQVTWLFQDGVCFVSLAALSDPAFIPFAVAEALGLPSARAADIQIDLLAALRDQELLLLLDNFEQLLPSTTFIESLLTSAPRITLLVTSRAALGLYGEHVFSLAPLPVPSLAKLPAPDELLHVPAITLFVDRAQAIRPAFTLTEANAAAVVTTCQRLDGLPLAIELAAARIKHMPPAELAARLTNRLATLNRGPQDAPARHRTLREAIAWSYDLLQPKEKQFFAYLSVFAGGFTAEAAQAVGHAIDPAEAEGALYLDSLVEKSLIQLTTDDPAIMRYSMLDTIREYALEVLAACGEISKTRLAHANYYLRLTAEINEVAQTIEQNERSNRLAGELDNLRAALNWSLVDEVAFDLGCALAVGLGSFWYDQGLFQEGCRWLKVVLADHSVPADWRGKALFQLGMLRRALGEYGLALTHFEEALALFRGRQDQLNIARVLDQMTHVALLQGSYQQAEQLAQQSLDLFRELNDLEAVASTLERLGTAAVEQAHYEKAVPLLETCLEIVRSLDLIDEVASVLNILGMAELGQKQTQKSLERFRAGLEIFQRRGQKLGLAWSWRNLGLAQLLDGQLAEAAKSFQGGLALYEEFGSVDGMAAVLEGIAGVMILRGHHQPGGRLLGVAAAARDRLGMPVSPNLQAIYDRIFLMSSFNPDDEPWAAELAYGRTIPFDQAMEELWPLLPLTDQPESSSNTPVT